MKRRYLLKLNAAVFTVLFLACVGAIAWLTERHSVSWDWAGAAHTGLSESSVALARQLDQPVRVAVFSPEGHFIERHVNGLLGRYGDYLDDLAWEFVNPDARPDLVREFGVERAGEIVIEYDGRHERVSVPSEAHFSAALERLRRGAGQTIGYLTGHGERSLAGQANYDLGSFGGALRQKGYQLRAVNLAEGAVLDGMDLLVVAGPRVDLLPGAHRALERYVDDGGRLLWLAEADDVQRLPGLIDRVGIAPRPGVLTDPQAARQLAVNDTRLVMVERYPEHPMTTRLTAPSLLPQVRALQWNATNGWDLEPLLHADARHRLVQDYEGDAVEISVPDDEPLWLAAALTREVPQHGSQQRIVVVGDGDFLSNTYVGNGANLQLGLNMVDWLTESEVFMDVYARAAPDQRLELTRPQTLVLGFGFLIALPALLFSLGAWRWWRRRAG